MNFYSRDIEEDFDIVKLYERVFYTLLPHKVEVYSNESGDYNELYITSKADGYPGCVIGKIIYRRISLDSIEIISITERVGSGNVFLDILDKFLVLFNEYIFLPITKDRYYGEFLSHLITYSTEKWSWNTLKVDGDDGFKNVPCDILSLRDISSDDLENYSILIKCNYEIF